MDKSGVNAAAIAGYRADCGADTELRQVKHLKQRGRAGSSRRQANHRPILGLRPFWPAAVILASVDLMHMIRKGQLRCWETLTSA